MGYFDEEKNVDQYLKIAEGYDGAELISILKKYLPEGSTILELGMGPGKDIDILNKTYNVTGSDTSCIFLNRYKKKNPDIELLLLDAIDMKTDKTFDCIFSNKVLHHLTKEDLKKSLVNQKNTLKDSGLLMHSFWHGNKEEFHHNLRFVYYTEKDLVEIIDNNFEIIELKRYTEMEKDDSIYTLLRKIN